MGRTIIAGNWKMNTTLTDAIALSIDIREQLTVTPDKEVIIFPPTPFLIPVRDAVRGSSIKLGVQNVHSENSGAFTGETSITMLTGICEYSLIGHSERRTVLNESDDLINQKVLNCLGNGTRIILCIGESTEEKQSGLASQVLKAQIESALRNVEDISNLVIAYEPVWAIGSGLVPESQDVNEILGDVVRTQIRSLYGTPSSQEIPLLYGGSVNPGNTNSFAQSEHINGVLVGGASLNAAQFVEICRQFTTAS